MLHRSNTGRQLAMQPATDRRLLLAASSGDPSSWHERAHAEISLDELAFRARAAFRSHPHVNNVVTHISGGDWKRVEATLRAIFDPIAERAGLSALARNILDLLCAERGVTGRILKPYFRAFLHQLLEPELAAGLISRLAALHIGDGGYGEGPTTSYRDRGARVTRVADIAPH